MASSAASIASPIPTTLIDEIEPPLPMHAKQDSPWKKIKSCFNCFKAPETLMATGATTFAAGLAILGTSILTPVAAITVPVSAVIIGTGAIIGIVGLALKAYKGRKKQAPPAPKTQEAVPKIPESISKTQESELHSTQESEEPLSNKYTREMACHIVTNVMRKAVAAQSYGLMFSQGSRFKALGQDLKPINKSKNERFGFPTLKHVQRISSETLSWVKNRNGRLSLDEADLVKRIVNQKWYFKHQSHGDLTKGTNKLTIDSSVSLERKDIEVKFDPLYRNELAKVRNDDFVFFSLELCGDPAKMPLHTLYSGFDYGCNAFLIKGNLPLCQQGYLTLDNQLHLSYFAESNEFNNKYYSAKEDRQYWPDTIFNPRFQSAHELIKVDTFYVPSRDKNLPLFTYQDMKEGLAHCFIDFIRFTRDYKFATTALDPRTSDETLDRLIHLVFQPEFHVPRIVSTDKFIKKNLREADLTNAILANNFNEVIKIAGNNRSLQVMAVGIAIEKNSPNAIDFLTKKFKPTKKELQMYKDLDSKDLDTTFASLLQFLQIELNALGNNQEKFDYVDDILRKSAPEELTLEQRRQLEAIRNKYRK